MGFDTRLETGADGGTLRAFHPRGHLPYLRRGRAAHGDRFRDFLRPVSGGGNSAGRLRIGPGSVDLVLRRADRLAGFGHSRHGDAHRNYLWLGFETAKRSGQFALHRSAHHPDLGTTRAVSSRVSAFLPCGALPHADSAHFAEALGANCRSRPTAAGATVAALATAPSPPARLCYEYGLLSPAPLAAS